MRPIFDAHLDLAWNALHWNRDLTQSLADMRGHEAHMTDHVARGRGTVTLPEMKKAGIHVCLGTVLVRSKPEVNPAAGFSRIDLDFQNQTIAHAIGMGQLAYYQMLNELGTIKLLRTADDLQQHLSAGKENSAEPLGVILAMEGADPIHTPQQAELWWNHGLRCVSLSHYAQGPYAPGTGIQGPVTPAGRELLQEFARLGMIVDLTHCAEPAFFEVLDLFPGPVLASHNMCRELVPGDRQFSDDQIRALIERGAVIGMAFDAWMLTPGWVRGESSPSCVSLSAAADHVDHICQLAGNVRHVGIGSDLDGGFGTEQTPHDLNSIADLQTLSTILADRGYSDTDLNAIFQGNFVRLFLENLPSI
ncbi:dipeptidase [Blastopirellula marina]|uniref:Putative peptidase n=1 Tax=Blastopirellula marina DSM 3645 TaxID=314230 RepID=A3ZZK0_9BACT|nr:membrane dipeptidase [Blastopirellula marina]EAQ78056.1 putative peptidase [Blastopirellula marina DSM 3645]